MNSTPELIYRSVLPTIAIEFQDNTFLDVDDIHSFTISKSDDEIPIGMAFIEIKIGKRPWHFIKGITINGQKGTLLSFDRHGYEIEDDEEDDDLMDMGIGYLYAKLIIKYELSDEELEDILSRRIIEVNFRPEQETANDEGKDTSTVLQRGEDTP